MIHQQQKQLMSHVTKSKSPNFGALPIYVDHLPQKKC
jgi:hypothetical protein